MFTWKTRCGLKFHFGQIDRSEISTEVSFTPPEAMWTLIMKLPHTEVKSQTGLIKRALKANREKFFAKYYEKAKWQEIMSMTYFKKFCFLIVRQICLPELLSYQGKKKKKKRPTIFYPLAEELRCQINSKVRQITELWRTTHVAKCCKIFLQISQENTCIGVSF